MDAVTYFEVKAVIELNDSLHTKIELGLNDINSDNYITDIEINEELKSHGVVFSVTANTLTIRLQSRDKSLFPENINSSYFNYMNDTAIIKLFYKLESDSTWNNFGVWYVKNWHASISSNDPYSVIIECTDILGKILGSAAPNIDIPYTMRLEEYIEKIMQEINSSLDDRYKIDWLILGTNKYNMLQTNSTVYDTIELLFDTLSKNFLIDIYINRDGKLIFDPKVVKNNTNIELSDSINVFSATLNNENLTSNDIKLKLDYNTYNIKDNVEVYNADVDLQNGTNKIDVRFDNKVFKISHIVVSGGVNNVYCNDIRWYKTHASIDIVADGSCTANIKIFGREIIESKNILEYGGGNEIIETSVSMLHKNLVSQYIVDLYNEIVRNRAIQCSSMISPEIKLNDVVNVQLDSLGIYGVYRVLRLSWKIDTSLDCVVTLI